MAIIGVGWLSRKGLGEALQRLGIDVPTLHAARHGLIGIGILLALGVTGLLSLASSVGIAVGQDVEKLSELLVGPLTQSIWGVLTLGLAAAIGEESILRGALQPRFGLLLTSIVFTLLHAQYGFSLATGVILVVGLDPGFGAQTPEHQHIDACACTLQHHPGVAGFPGPLTTLDKEYDNAQAARRLAGANAL